MSSEFSEKNYLSKMEKSIQSLKKDISTLRTASALLPESRPGCGSKANDPDAVLRDLVSQL